MRGVLFALALGLLVGCGKKEEADADAPGKGAEKVPDLPAATSKLRVGDFDLYEAYRPGAKDAYPHHGKRVVCRTFGSNIYGVIASGKNLILEGSENLFRRPRAVFVMRNDRGFKKGGGEYAQDVYIEGTVQGLVAFDSRPWSKDWLKLTEGFSFKGQFLLIEDAVLVAPPKD